MVDKTEPLLIVTDLHKKYGKVDAVRGISFAANKGETLVIMGPSGCGKSTTIRCINRITEPDSGTVLFDGIDITALDEERLRQVRRRIGFVFQGFNLIHRLTCLDNVALGLVIHGMSPEEARDRAGAALKTVGLSEAFDRKPDALSGGQQQRVGIARALAYQPELMLWDEPTASLDPILVGEVLEVMEDLSRSGKTTMVIVTHELAFARKVATNVILMNQGQIVEEGSPNEVFSDPKSDIGRRYHKMMVKW